MYLFHTAVHVEHCRTRRAAADLLLHHGSDRGHVHPSLFVLFGIFHRLVISVEICRSVRKQVVLSAAGPGGVAQDWHVAGALRSGLVHTGGGSGILGVIVDLTGAENEL